MLWFSWKPHEHRFMNANVYIGPMPCYKHRSMYSIRPGWLACVKYAMGFVLWTLILETFRLLVWSATHTFAHLKLNGRTSRPVLPCSRSNPVFSAGHHPCVFTFPSVCSQTRHTQARTRSRPRTLTSTSVTCPAAAAHTQAQLLSRCIAWSKNMCFASFGSVY